MSGKREEGLKVVSEMLALTPEAVDALKKGSTSDGFASHLAELAMEHAFADIWTRPGLDRRARSLVTLGILIGLRASSELEFHFVAAVRNGVTIQEIEEVIYHATAYAGFPAASSARAVALEALRRAKLI